MDVTHRGQYELRLEWTKEPFHMVVLIVEDSLTTAATLKGYVLACGHQAVRIHSAAFASAMCDRTIDLVLMDIMLPGCDGYELAAQLRQQGLQAPIVAVTSLGDDSAKRKQCGIDDYIAKPVSLQTMKELLERRFANQRSRPTN